MINAAGATIAATTSTAYIRIAVDNQGVVEARNGALFVEGEDPALPISGTWRSEPQGSLYFIPRNDVVFAAPVLQNHVEIDVQGTATGTINVSAGETVTFTNGDLQATINVDSGGTFVASGGIVHATINGAGTFKLALGGTLDIDVTDSIAHWIIEGGRLINSHQIASGVTVEMVPHATFVLQPGSILINDGTVKLAGEFLYAETSVVFSCDGSGGNPATLVNYGTIELGTRSALSPHQSCLASPQMTNAAGATIAATTSTAYIRIAVDNQGVVEARNGALFVEGEDPALPITGTWRSEPQGSLYFIPRNDVVFAAPVLQNHVEIDVQGTATGTIDVSAGETVTFTNGDLQATINVDGGGTFVASGGIVHATINGAGTFKLALGGTLDIDVTDSIAHWIIESGRLINSHRIASGVTVEMVPQATFMLQPGSILVNDGTVKLAGDFLYNETSIVFLCDGSGGNPATLINYGTIELGTRGALSPHPSCLTSPQVTNAAGATIASTESSASIRVPVDNAGLVTSGSAALVIPARITNSGQLRAGAGGLLELGWVDNTGLFVLGTNANYWCTPPCAFVNEPEATIELWGGPTLELTAGFDNQGTIEFRGTSARGIRANRNEARLGRGRMQLDEPDWVPDIVTTGVLAPPLPIPLIDFHGISGGCVEGGGGLVEAFVGGACLLGEFSGGPLSQNTAIGLFGGLGAGWNGSLGVNTFIAPGATFGTIHGWSWCLEASAGVPILGVSGTGCISFAPGELFDLSDDSLLQLEALGEKYWMAGPAWGSTAFSFWAGSVYTLIVDVPDIVPTP